jgi:hypothetical protein
VAAEVTTQSSEPPAAEGTLPGGGPSSRIYQSGTGGLPTLKQAGSPVIPNTFIVYAQRWTKFYTMLISSSLLKEEMNLAAHIATLSKGVTNIEEYTSTSQFPHPKCVLSFSGQC